MDVLHSHVQKQGFSFVMLPYNFRCSVLVQKLKTKERLLNIDTLYENLKRACKLPCYKFLCLQRGHCHCENHRAGLWHSNPNKSIKVTVL